MQDETSIVTHRSIQLAHEGRPALLLVEDDDILREAVAFVLSDAGREIVLASSGEEALALITEVEAFDGLYTDINLSGPVDGWEVGEAFYRKWPARPIVYASARNWLNARIMATGVFLQKPFAFGKLTAALAGSRGPAGTRARPPTP